jgi:hypothetical protein
MAGNVWRALIGGGVILEHAALGGITVHPDGVRPARYCSKP